jgi:hypothetical protein
MECELVHFDLDIATEVEVSTRRQRVAGKKGTTKTSRKRTDLGSAEGTTDLASVNPTKRQKVAGKRQKVTGKENLNEKRLPRREVLKGCD